MFQSLEKTNPALVFELPLKTCVASLPRSMFPHDNCRIQSSEDVFFCKGDALGVMDSWVDPIPSLCQ